MQKLCYNRPAEHWDEALPIGNGRLGAMVYGKARGESLQLNEESMWSGKKIDRINPDCAPNLEKIRELLRNGKIREAEELSLYAMSGLPQSQRSYQTLGELIITDNNPGGEYTDYSRSLDLEQAVTTVTYTVRGTTYRREVFASCPADCIVLHMTADGEETLNFSCRFERRRHLDRAFAPDKDTIAYDGGNAGITFAGALQVFRCDGEWNTVGEHLIVRRATEVTLLFTAATTFRWSNPLEKALEILRAQHTGNNSYEELKQAHIADYRELFDRVELRLYGEEAATGDPSAKEATGQLSAETATGELSAEAAPVCPTTEERLKSFSEGKADPELIALYFQYGRYLLIASSRPGGLPATLQGIWNEDFMPMWDSKYTININLEMNYWPVDICNLSECSEPFFSLLKRVCESGRETAERMYGCRGFVAHHNTDIHADTAPQDHYIPASYWVLGGAWLALHIWEHYEFTKDVGFLEDNYEVLKAAVLFFCDFLTENEKGQLVTSPSVSPENTYIMADGTRGRMCEGPTMDNEILTDLFHAFLKATDVLKKENSPAAEEEELSEAVRRMLIKLPPLLVGSDGRLLEWMEEYQEAEPGHRHISHLFGLFPSARITMEDTPELARAARKSLEYRLQHGGGHTGWSRAWIILLWARLRDSERVYENIRELLRASTFINLMDNHPAANKRGRVFQIDGNLGGITGIAEMLVQSHNGRLLLLPALPEELPSGCVRGLRVRGNAEIGIEWKHGKLERFHIEAHSDYTGELCYEGRTVSCSLQKGQKCSFDAALAQA